MTRPLRTVTPTAERDKARLLRPIPQSKNLTQVVVERLASEIASGRMEPGARLPSEQELMSAYSVSRTVVREAVAALKADGLLIARQGAGTFVANDSARAAFRIESSETDGLQEVINVMELRVAVEVEAAALAAERASPRQRLEIEAACRACDSAIAAGAQAIAEDFALHAAIAAATGNSQFSEFLRFLGRHVIPRQTLRNSVGTLEEQRLYLAQIQKEHARIVEAIASQDPGEARRAMRNHLARSLQRYRGLALRQAAARSTDTRK